MYRTFTSDVCLPVIVIQHRNSEALLLLNMKGYRIKTLAELVNFYL